MKITRKQLRQLINESLKLSFKPQATEKEKDQMKQVLSDLLGLDDIDYHIEDIEYAVLPHKDTETDHDQYHTQFTNELDNEIELSIEPHQGGPCNQLTITMRGPDSEMTNTITREEAVQLNEMLTRYLVEETSRNDPDELTPGEAFGVGVDIGRHNEKKYKPGDYEVLDYDMDDNQVPDHMEKF